MSQGQPPQLKCSFCGDKHSRDATFSQPINDTHRVSICRTCTLQAIKFHVIDTYVQMEQDMKANGIKVGLGTLKDMVKQELIADGETVPALPRIERE